MDVIFEIGIMILFLISVILFFKTWQMFSDIKNIDKEMKKTNLLLNNMLKLHKKLLDKE